MQVLHEFTKGAPQRLDHFLGVTYDVLSRASELRHLGGYPLYWDGRLPAMDEYRRWCPTGGNQWH
jgi:hypothetical protein